MRFARKVVLRASDVIWRGFSEYTMVFLFLQKGLVFGGLVIFGCLLLVNVFSLGEVTRTAETGGSLGLLNGEYYLRTQV